MPAAVAGRPSRTATTFSASGMKGLTTGRYYPTMPDLPDRDQRDALIRS
jgi:hypothetical protein